MRTTKEERILIDEFQLLEDIDLNGVLALSNEFDETEAIYVSIGQNSVGWINREDLVEVAKKILEFWEKKKENPT